MKAAVSLPYSGNLLLRHLQSSATRCCSSTILPPPPPSSSLPFITRPKNHYRNTNRPRPFNTARTPTTTSISALSSSMGSSFKPEQARVPPALQLPTPPITKFKIGLCQLLVIADKERNIAHARQAIHDAAKKGAQLVVLPEIWNSPYSNDSFPVYAEDIDVGGDASPSTAMLSEVARVLKITIVGGSIPERCGDKLYNTCCVFDTDGKLKAKHRKIHLFDIDIPGKISFQESKTLTAGETPTVVDTEVGRIGIGICYDIRFQELAMLYAARGSAEQCQYDLWTSGVHLICYPGAFNMTTGPLHWELLQRARAVDNQLYVATCSPARDASAGYVAWGHSTLIGPFGEVLATAEHDEAIIISEVDYSQIELRRTNLPLEKQRRGDLYQLVDVQRLNSQGNA
ncbi:omega-amidase, chloroplastic-like isoform X1 [Actinidia eriantha]|uniref:omega-amidase, chloroplastic-like isoform X1 n=1 Tax=Actinidia eriantha TaxID=165200 RepID=UPI00258B775C|nr:omega-amidase, chloroplastic-like isoform X1 [Actinidia eriantha]